MGFEGKTDREVYVEMHFAASELVRRYQQYLDLVPSRPQELAASKEKISNIRNSERVLRGLYERCRDIRETIEEAAEDWGEHP